MHESKLIDFHEVRNCRQKMVLKHLQVRLTIHVAIKEKRPDDALDSNRSPDCHPRRVKRLFCMPLRVFFTPIAKVVMVDTAMEMKMCLIGEEKIKQVLGVLFDPVELISAESQSVRSILLKQLVKSAQLVGMELLVVQDSKDRRR